MKEIGARDGLQSLTALLGAGVVSLAEVAVDGTKVRANAGQASSSARRACRSRNGRPGSA